jgi:hypothetical protein
MNVIEFFQLSYHLVDAFAVVYKKKNPAYLRILQLRTENAVKVEGTPGKETGYL